MKSVSLVHYENMLRKLFWGTQNTKINFGALLIYFFVNIAIAIIVALNLFLQFLLVLVHWFMTPFI